MLNSLTTQENNHTNNLNNTFRRHNIIAEIGTTHNGDMVKAKELIVAAKEAGAHTAKFQWVLAEEIVSPHTPPIELFGGKVDIYSKFKQLELHEEFYQELSHYCATQEIEFMCSIFGHESFDLLLKCNTTTIKIASPEINYMSLLEYIRSTLKDTRPTVYLSDGISCLIDMYRACSAFKEFDTYLLHCITQYPADINMYALSKIQLYSTLFSCGVGISDHTEHPFLLPLLATLYGSSCTEKHFKLENSKEGLDDSYALAPSQFAIMSRVIRDCEAILHTPNTPSTSSILNAGLDIYLQYQENLNSNYFDINSSLQYKHHTELTTYFNTMISKIYHGNHTAANLPIYYSTRRSMYAKYEILSGEALDLENTTTFRSEDQSAHGIPAEYFHCIVTQNTTQKLYAKENIAAYQPIQWSMIALQ